MYRIGEFSTLSKVTVKALRYYEKEGLLQPKQIDPETGYRYYETDQLMTVASIVSLRQIGLSIAQIRKIKNGTDLREVLKIRKREVEQIQEEANDQLLRIQYLMEEKNMKYEVVMKTLPEVTVYYKEGVIEHYSDLTQFVLSSADECYATNPNIKCLEPDYCYVNYLDREYKEQNIKIRYAQAVTEAGVPNEIIRFKTLEPLLAACIYHQGSYSNLGEAYAFMMKWIEENGYEIMDDIRERYIDGIWNKEDEKDWLTEIQVPVKKK